MSETLVSIALGANLGEPAAMVRHACGLLADTPGIMMTQCSSLYRSAPMGPSDQPDYINAAVLAQVSLEPLALLDCLQAVERKCGRSDKRRHWGEREIDLDIITYGACIIHNERLTIPHPGAYRRCFVLAPLAEINARLEIPGYGYVEDLLPDCNTGAVEKTEELTLP